MENLIETYEYLKTFLTEERAEKIDYQAQRSSDFVLPILEDVYQFRNAAAIVRSAEGCGFHKVVALEKINVFEPNLDLTKGAENWVEVEKMPAQIESIKKIRARGYKIVAVSPERDATMLSDFKIEEPVALVFGTEWQGINEEVLDLADETLAIPMYGFTQSFNVSVAAAICMYELKQKILSSGIDYRLTEEKMLQLKIRWAIKSIKSGPQIYEEYLKKNI